MFLFLTILNGILNCCFHINAFERVRCTDKCAPLIDWASGYFRWRKLDYEIDSNAPMRAKRYNQVILFLIYQIYSPKFIFSKGLTSIASNVDRQTCHRFSELRSFNLFPGLSQDQGRKHLLMMLVLRFFNKRSSGSSPTLVFFTQIVLFPCTCSQFPVSKIWAVWIHFGSFLE